VIGRLLVNRSPLSALFALAYDSFLYGLFQGRVLAAYLSAHRTVINGSALCAALAVAERD
jgi:hypothetical protein